MHYWKEMLCRKTHVRLKAALMSKPSETRASGVKDKRRHKRIIFHENHQTGLWEYTGVEVHSPCTVRLKLQLSNLSLLETSHL